MVVLHVLDVIVGFGWVPIFWRHRARAGLLCCHYFASNRSHLIFPAKTQQTVSGGSKSKPTCSKDYDCFVNAYITVHRIGCGIFEFCGACCEVFVSTIIPVLIKQGPARATI
jgi:hypothetical protein